MCKQTKNTVNTADVQTDQNTGNTADVQTDQNTGNTADVQTDQNTVNTADVQTDQKYRQHKEQKRKGETKGQGNKDGKRQEETHSA
jgi:ribosomal protein L19E